MMNQVKGVDNFYPFLKTESPKEHSELLYSKGNTEKEAMWEDKVKFRRQFGTQVGKTSEEALQTWEELLPW